MWSDVQWGAGTLKLCFISGERCSALTPASLRGESAISIPLPKAAALDKPACRKSSITQLRWEYLGGEGARNGHKTSPAWRYSSSRQFTAPQINAFPPWFWQSNSSIFSRLSRRRGVPWHWEAVVNGFWCFQVKVGNAFLLVSLVKASTRRGPHSNSLSEGHGRLLGRPTILEIRRLFAHWFVLKRGPPHKWPPWWIGERNLPPKMIRRWPCISAGSLTL